MIRGHLVRAWLAYLTAIAYGSLLPFEPRPLSIQEVWAVLVRPPYLPIGVEGRADLVANLALYVPFGLLTAGGISQWVPRGGVARWPAAWLACAAIGGVVEFLQVFFPPWRVSWNDVLAEAIGAALGIALWVVGRHVWTALARALSLGVGYWAWSARADGSSRGSPWVSACRGAVAAAGAFAAAPLAERWLRDRGC